MIKQNYDYQEHIRNFSYIHNTILSFKTYFSRANSKSQISQENKAIVFIKEYVWTFFKGPYTFSKISMNSAF